MDLQSINFLGFLVTAVLLTLMPGPDILFVLTQSITRGRKAGIIFACGLCSGLIVHAIAVSLGLTVLLMNSPIVFTILKLLGATYLLYLGIKAFLARHKSHIELPKEVAFGGKLYRKGILMSALNPKLVLFFIAFFPQFIDKSIENPIPQMLLLCLLFMVQAFCIFSVVAIVADKLLRSFLQKPRTSLIVNIIEAFVFCAIGVSILL